MEVSISVKGLTLNYGSKTVIENLNLNFKKNEFTAIVGNNGSGKSTFLRTVCTLHREYSGIIKVNEKEISQLDAPFKSGVFSLLSQNQDISFNISVRELLLMGRFRFKKTFENYSKEDVDKVKEICDELNINSFLEKSFYELSGGEQQLVLIAQALIQDADIYLFDEPTQNLDLKNAHFIINLISRLPQKGKTILCSTHDLHLLDDVNGEMVNFSGNEIVLELISNPNILKNTEILKS